MALTDDTASQTTIAAAGPRVQVVEQTGRSGGRHTPKAGTPLVAIFVSVIALAAYGSAPSAQASAEPSASARAAGHAPHPPPSRIDAIVTTAKAVYKNEVNGPKLYQQLDRIARDGVLVNALGRRDVAGAQAEALAQLKSAFNHFAHVTRISVIGGSRVLVNATLNPDGVYVVAPASRVLRLRGRVLGTLLVCIQDVTGFVKLVHDLTGADILVRGASGHVRTSLAAAVGVGLPVTGRVTIAGRPYVVRSFHETAWGNEPLTVWILV